MKNRLLLAVTAAILMTSVVSYHAISGKVANRYGKIKNSFGIGSPITLTGLNEVRKYTKLSFPKGCVLLGGEFRGGLSRYVVAKIQFPPKEVQKFLAQLPYATISTTQSELDEKNYPMIRKMGWKPSLARRYLAVDGLPIEGEFVQAGISLKVVLDDPKVAVVYLYYQD